MILEVITIISGSILFHELGHYICLRIYTGNKNLEIKFYFDNLFHFGFRCGHPIDYINLSKMQKFKLYLAGIALGAVPIISASINSVFFLFFLPVYVVGCWNDVIRIVRLIPYGNNLPRAKN